MTALTPEDIENLTKAMCAARPARKKRPDNRWVPPEWLKYVTPIVFICVGFAWNNMKGAANADKTEIKVVSDKVDSLEARLPLDYVPRAEHLRNAEIDRSLTQQREDRVTRIEAKVDRILENQESRQSLLRGVR